MISTWAGAAWLGSRGRLLRPSRAGLPPRPLPSDPEPTATARRPAAAGAPIGWLGDRHRRPSRNPPAAGAARPVRRRPYRPPADPEPATASPAPDPPRPWLRATRPVTTSAARDGPGT